MSKYTDSADAMIDRLTADLAADRAENQRLKDEINTRVALSRKVMEGRDKNVDAMADALTAARAEAEQLRAERDEWERCADLLHKTVLALSDDEPDEIVDLPSTAVAISRTRVCTCPIHTTPAVGDDTEGQG